MRQLGVRRGAQPRLGGGLGAQITARRVPIRTEGAHVQHPAHSRGARGGHHLGSELGVHGVEARAPALVQDPDEVHDRIAAGEQLTQDPRLMHVRDPQLDGVEHPQPLGARETAGGYAHPVPREREPDDQLRADKAAAAEHTDVHITPLPGRPAHAGRRFSAAGSTESCCRAALPAPAPRRPWRARVTRADCRPGRDSHPR